MQISAKPPPRTLSPDQKVGAVAHVSLWAVRYRQSYSKLLPSRKSHSNGGVERAALPSYLEEHLVLQKIARSLTWTQIHVESTQTLTYNGTDIRACPLAG